MWMRFTRDCCRGRLDGTHVFLRIKKKIAELNVREIHVISNCAHQKLFSLGDENVKNIFFLSKRL